MTTQQLPPEAARALVAGIVRPCLEVAHGMRSRRQIRKLASPALERAIAASLGDTRDRTPIARIGDVRWQVNGSGATFSGHYWTTDGRCLPVAGQLARNLSTGRPELVELETVLRRHTRDGPRPPAVRQQPQQSTRRKR